MAFVCSGHILVCWSDELFLFYCCMSTWPWSIPSWPVLSGLSGFRYHWTPCHRGPGAPSGFSSASQLQPESVWTCGHKSDSAAATIHTCPDVSLRQRQTLTSQQWSWPAELSCACFSLQSSSALVVEAPDGSSPACNQTQGKTLHIETPQNKQKKIS